jgi:hypothetical protein
MDGFAGYHFQHIRRVPTMASITEFAPRLYDLTLMNCKIDSMELFRFDRAIMKHPAPRAAPHAQLGDTCWQSTAHPEKCGDFCCGLFKITSVGYSGWGTFAMTYPQGHFDLVRWASVYMRLKGLPVAEALQIVKTGSGAWGAERRGTAEAALIDLANKLLQQSSQENKNEFALRHDYLIEVSEAYFSF